MRAFVRFEGVFYGKAAKQLVEIADRVEEGIFGPAADPEQFELLVDLLRIGQNLLEVEAAGLEEAARLAEGPAEVIGLAKTLMARSFETTLADMFAFEGFGQVLAMSNPEFREGLNAAIESRQADFVGAAAGQLNKPGASDSSSGPTG